MRRTTLIVSLALFAAACGTASVPETDQPASTTTTSQVTTTSTTEGTTTTSDPCGSATIDADVAISLTPGCAYSNSEFAIPMVLAPDRDGWVSFGYGDRWFSLDLDEDGDGTTDAALTVLLFQENLELEAILESIVSRDRITAEGELMEVTIDGLPATGLDIRLAEHSRFPCGSRISRFLNTGSYVSLVNDGPNRTFGIPACRTSRIWAVTVGDTTATFVGAVRDDNEFDALIPIVESFLESGVSFGAGDG